MKCDEAGQCFISLVARLCECCSESMDLTVVLFFQEAKMLIARAYRHTEKLLLDNRDKLTLVSFSLLLS